MARQRAHIKVRNVSDTVERILVTNIESRENDHKLYAAYLRECGYSATLSFFNVMNLVQSGEIASIESVGRIRRQLQSNKPELSPVT
jgi:hypothetical protein